MANTKTLEREIENEFVMFAESVGCLCLKLRIDGRNGFPDRTLLLPGGRVLFLEFKRQSGHVSPQQIAWVKKLEELGFRVAVVRSVAEATALMMGAK